jgi:hypothetical protein
MISGFSGLPKFRLSVVASGRAPTAQRLRIGLRHRLLAAFDRVGAHVARGDIGGEGQHLVGAVDPHDARAAPGVRIVSAMTWLSYCS